MILRLPVMLTVLSVQRMIKLLTSLESVIASSEFVINYWLVLTFPKQKRETSADGVLIFASDFIQKKRIRTGSSVD